MLVARSTYVSGRLPGFASYGAALAGLTAGFVVLLSAPAPLTAFDTALERGAEIVIGVGCVYWQARSLRSCRANQPAGDPGRAAAGTCLGLGEHSPAPSWWLGVPGRYGWRPPAFGRRLRSVRGRGVDHLRHDPGRGSPCAAISGGAGLGSSRA